MNRLAVALTLLALVGCSQGDQRSAKVVPAAGGQAQAMVPDAAFGFASAGAATANAYEARIRQQRAFAALPDRGELLSYEHGGRQDRLADGAYTWHRVGVSEEHALRAIATGHLRLATPSGQALDIRYDHHVEHPSGDLSWVGHIEGQPGAQTILTFGADAVYGSIGQPGKRSLRLTTRNGSGWIVETDPDKLAGIASAGANPRKPDALAVPKTLANFADTPLVQPSVARATAAAAAATTIDVLVGYTQGFASAQDGTSGVMTRLNYLVAVGNEALANSQINARIRLVHAMQVTYADASTNESALEQLTGYDSSSEQYTTPNPAFNALRAARETYGADLVTLVRAFRDPEQDGCGIAWLIGGGQSGVSPGDGQDYFGYSVVSDGTDRNEGDGETYFCRDETLIHELAHNIGSQHDREASEGDDGRLDPDDYGAFAYSFGLKAGASAGNFYTIMAYGDEAQQDYRIFSNPRVTAFCGGRACGTAGSDNARSLAQLVSVIARFRATAVEEEDEDNAGVVAGNFNGDGRSDILWREGRTGANAIWLSGNAGTQQAITGVRNLAWKVAGTGDFNRDGRSDILWREGRTGANAIWLSGNAGTQQAITGVRNLAWKVAGTGDFNRDGRSDILWREGRTGANAIWLSGNAATQQAITGVRNLAWKVAGTGDFNGDGRSDILWREGRTGANAIWLSGNAATQQAITGVRNLAWKVAGTGDFNGDGRSDILWREGRTGANAIWLSGNAATQQAITGVRNLAWKVAGTGDFNGDGRSDILWREGRTGANAIWLSGNAATQQAVTDVKNLSWVVAG